MSWPEKAQTEECREPPALMAGGGVALHKFVFMHLRHCLTGNVVRAA